MRLADMSGQEVASRKAKRTLFAFVRTVAGMSSKVATYMLRSREGCRAQLFLSDTSFVD